MEIRKATINDITDISRIHALTWKAAYQGLVPQQYLDDLKEENWIGIFTESISKHLFTVQLIFDGEKPVGCISYGKSRENELPGWGEIVSLYLLPQYWGERLCQAPVGPGHGRSEPDLSECFNLGPQGKRAGQEIL